MDNKEKLQNLGLNPNTDLKAQLKAISEKGPWVLLNDDGPDEPRLFTNEAAIRELYRENDLPEPKIYVIVPSSGESAMGAETSQELSAISEKNPEGIGKNTRFFVQNGTPADGVAHAERIVTEKKIGVTISGTNNTTNLAYNLSRSGTVAITALAAQSAQNHDSKFNGSVFIATSDNEGLSTFNQNFLKENVKSAMTHAVVANNAIGKDGTNAIYNYNVLSNSKIDGVEIADKNRSKDFRGAETPKMIVQVLTPTNQEELQTGLGAGKVKTTVGQNYQDNINVLTKLQQMQGQHRENTQENFKGNVQQNTEIGTLKTEIANSKAELQRLKDNMPSALNLLKAAERSNIQQKREKLKEHIEATTEKLNNLMKQQKQSQVEDKPLIPPRKAPTPPPISTIPKATSQTTAQSANPAQPTKFYEPIPASEARFAYPESKNHGRIASELSAQPNPQALNKKFDELFKQNSPNKAVTADFNKLFENSNKTTEALLNSPYRADTPKPERLAAVINHALDTSSGASIYSQMNPTARRNFDDFAKDAIERISNVNKSQNKPPLSGLSADVSKRYPNEVNKAMDSPSASVPENSTSFAAREKQKRNPAQRNSAQHSRTTTGGPG